MCVCVCVFVFVCVRVRVSVCVCMCVCACVYLFNYVLLLLFLLLLRILRILRMLFVFSFFAFVFGFVFVFLIILTLILNYCSSSHACSRNLFCAQGTAVGCLDSCIVAEALWRIAAVAVHSRCMLGERMDAFLEVGRPMCPTLQTPQSRTAWIGRERRCLAFAIVI